MYDARYGEESMRVSCSSLAALLANKKSESSARVRSHATRCRAAPAWWACRQRDVTEGTMGNVIDRGTESERQEQAIASLIEGTTVAPKKVRDLFLRELARLERGDRIRTHLQALAISRVRSMLRTAAPNAPP